jgi:hypothetical protein
MWDIDKLVAIDIHTHAHTPQEFADPEELKQREAMRKYFGQKGEELSMKQIADYYRERKIGCVIFSVDSESKSGFRRFPNEEVAKTAAENNDIMMAFGSIDPAKGAAGANEARRLIRDFGIKGFKFHPSTQGFFPNDRMAYGLYEVIAEHKLPAIFHSGHSGIGTGMPGGGKMRTGGTFLKSKPPGADGQPPSGHVPSGVGNTPQPPLDLVLINPGLWLSFVVGVLAFSRHMRRTNLLRPSPRSRYFKLGFPPERLPCAKRDINSHRRRQSGSRVRSPHRTRDRGL